MPQENDAVSAPANQIFRYEVRLLGIDETDEERLSEVHHNRYSVGDRALIRHPSRRCDASSLDAVRLVHNVRHAALHVSGGVERRACSTRNARSGPVRCDGHASVHLCKS